MNTNAERNTPINTRYHTINVEKSAVDRAVQQLRDLGYTCEGIQTAAAEPGSTVS
jgi:hypothetical protein